MQGASPQPTQAALVQLINDNLKTARHVALVSVPIGLTAGAAISAYDYLVNVVLWDRFSGSLSPLALCFLPLIGMVLTGLILQIFRVESSAMADEVVSAYHNPQVGLRYRQVWPKLAASIATMGFGCSAGMEGASKWLGASVSAWLQTRFNRISWLKAMHGPVEITMLAGAAAGISAIFRAPLTGAIMGIESPYKKDLAHDALIHALVASALSFATFSILRNDRPYFPINFHYVLVVRDLFYCIPLGILAGVSSLLFLGCLRAMKRLSAELPLPRLGVYVCGGLLLTVVALSMYFLIGEPATLQAGLPLANRLLSGHYDSQTAVLIFVAKLLATAITFGWGGVGGLFVPSATIGAALGAVCDIYFLPSQPGLFTLVGIAAFTGASYNSLLFAAVFIAEASGSPALVVPGLIASCTAYLISAGVSNSPSQRQARTDAINIPLERLQG